MKRGLINPANNNDPLDLPTHRTFVQWLTLPEVVLKYFKQWQTKGNENIIQTIVPHAKVARMVVPTII